MLYIIYLQYFGIDQDRSVSTTIALWGMKDWDVMVRVPAGEEHFLFPTASRPAMPTQSLLNP